MEIKQHTANLTSDRIPKKVLQIIKNYNETFGSMAMYCIWLKYGTDEEKKRAKKILRLYD